MRRTHKIVYFCDSDQDVELRAADLSHLGDDVAAALESGQLSLQAAHAVWRGRSRAASSCCPPRTGG